MRSIQLAKQKTISVIIQLNSVQCKQAKVLKKIQIFICKKKKKLSILLYFWRQHTHTVYGGHLTF